MLTADLVHARRRGTELQLVRLDPPRRARAIELAQQVIDTVHALVGATREEVDSAIRALVVPPRDRKLFDGLCKLVDDGCTFAEAAAVDPVALRRAVFVRAAEARRALPVDGRFDRSGVLHEIASQFGLADEEIEGALHGDLRGAHRLERASEITATALVERWEIAQVQAMLLRAVRVIVDVRCASPNGYRILFRKLKFLRLLHEIHGIEGGHRVIIDGPFSLFEAVTKYGLQLAMMVPALLECDDFTLEADVRWGKERTPLVFRIKRKEVSAPALREREIDPVRLADEVEALLTSFRALDTGWHVAPTPVVLDLPGVGISVPDLVFEHAKTRAKIYLEVMGYWSRDAVFRRVELVQQGLGERILFAVSKRLRVSEEVLGDDLPGALYVYKGTMSAKSIAERLDSLAGRA